MAASEARTAYELAASEKANIIIGSSEILTPENFMRGLADLAPGTKFESVADVANEEIDIDLVIDKSRK